MLLRSLILGLACMGSARASDQGFQTTGKPAYLHCKGTSGEITIEANEDLKELKVALVNMSGTHLIEIDSITAPRFHGSPGVSTTSFTYEDPSKNFITIDGYFSKPVWHAAHEGCLPTRVEGHFCIPEHAPGFWGNDDTNWISFGFVVNPNKAGTYLLNSFEGKDYGIPQSAPIGDNVVCEGELL